MQYRSVSRGHWSVVYLPHLTSSVQGSVCYENVFLCTHPHASMHVGAHVCHLQKLVGVHSVYVCMPRAKIGYTTVGCVFLHVTVSKRQKHPMITQTCGNIYNVIFVMPMYVQCVKIFESLQHYVALLSDIDSYKFFTMGIQSGLIYLLWFPRFLVG